jgi:hypothetical protein
VAGRTVQRVDLRRFWAAARQQHGVVTRDQLLGFGFTSHAIDHRITNGRLHRVWRGVFAVGRPALTPYGRWMAATLTCGPESVLSHRCAAALLEILADPSAPIEVSIPARMRRSRPGIQVHRRTELIVIETSRVAGIPVTTPVCTLIDLSAQLSAGELESAVNEADRRDLVDPETLRTSLERCSPLPGVRALRRLLDRATFTLTDSELERCFLPIATAAGLPQPLTGQWVNGFKVDFLWPELGLVVETDGLRYHRTPVQQARDRRRDQVHTAAGLTQLRFTHSQIRFEPGYVRATLTATARRLAAPSSRP